MNDQDTPAIRSLKAAKANNLTFYQATQQLKKEGFSDDDILQATYGFRYHSDQDESIADQLTSADKEAQLAMAKAKMTHVTVREMKKDMHQSAAIGVLGGNTILGSYFRTKFLKSYFTIKDLEKSGQLGPVNGERVYQRYGIVKFYAYLSIAAIVLLLLFFFPLLISLPMTIIGMLRAESTPPIMELWSLAGMIAILVTPFVLFLSRKESTIIKAIYAILGGTTFCFIMLGIVMLNPIIIISGIVIGLYGLWVTRKIGLVSILRARQAGNSSTAK